MKFTDVSPSLDNYWRAVILFGRNVASYKFALGQTLLEVVQQGKSFVPLTELAVPFSRHLADHLKTCDRQATSPSSRFLDECRRFNRGELTREELVDATVRLGFGNVIDAFHVVGDGPIVVEFFKDERNAPGKGIRLTDDLFKLTETYQLKNLPSEVEARWRLVETAWELSLPSSALVVSYDAETGGIVAETRRARRKAVAPAGTRSTATKRAGASIASGTSRWWKGRTTWPTWTTCSRTGSSRSRWPNPSTGSGTWSWPVKPVTGVSEGSSTDCHNSVIWSGCTDGMSSS